MSCHHCYKFLLWYVHLIGQPPLVLPHVRKSGFPEIFAGGIRNPGLWNLDPQSHERLESGIQVPRMQRIQNSVPVFSESIMWNSEAKTVLDSLT